MSINNKPSERSIAVAPVLVVESDFFLSGEIRAVLEEIGLTVHLAPTSDAALPWAKEQAFSLAILDPKGVGDADARVARKLMEQNPAIRLILLFPLEHLQRVENPEPFAKAIHLPKPFRSHVFRTTVLSVMGIADSDQPGTTLKSE